MEDKVEKKEQDYEIDLKGIKSERAKKIELSKVNSGERESRIIEKYHPEAYRQLENTSKAVGFKRLLIDHREKAGHVKPEVTKDVVFYPYNYLLNHEKLMKEYDETFSKTGAKLVLTHERHHFDKEPQFVFKKLNESLDSLWSNKEHREHFKAVAKEQGLDFKEALKRLDKLYYLREEMQTDVNMFTRNYENKDQFIKDFATRRVYIEFLVDGEKSLTRDYKFEPEEQFITQFIKPKIISEIYTKEKELKKDLLDKYKSHHSS